MVTSKPTTLDNKNNKLFSASDIVPPGQDPKTPPSNDSESSYQTEKKKDTARPAAPVAIPQGWTDDPEEMGTEFYWNPTDGEGYALAESYGLEDPVPVMRTTRESGGAICMFRAAGGKYFLWNQIEDIVCEIEDPTSLEDIKEKIAKKNLVGLRLKELS